MRFLKNSICLFSLVVALSACGPIYKTSYNYIPPANMQGRMCLNTCLGLQSHCQESCTKQQNQCEIIANQQAIIQFQAYKAQQKATDHRVRKTLNDFVNDSQCYQSCDCTPIYNQCYSNCGGVVNTTQTCVAFCNQQ